MMDTLTIYEPRISRSPRINLNPGELYIAKEPTTVWTVLGSYVAIIFYSAKLKVGGIAHAQLPEERLKEQRCSDFCPHPCYALAPDESRFKYVACSFRYLHEYFMGLGIAKHDITVKLFGGANMFPMHQRRKSVGEENVEVARKMIDRHGLRLVSEHTGGTMGRTLHFYSGSGKVWLKNHASRPFTQAQPRRSAELSPWPESQ
jgi:chemotaxis protein CheD